MEQSEEKTARYYVNKYKMQRHFDFESGELTYQKELQGREKNIILSLVVDSTNDDYCKLMVMKYYKKKWDKKWECYGVFGRPHYIENIKNDLQEKQTYEELKRNL